MKTNDRYRPKFHYTAEKGWINDPNGFSRYQGEYHLFAQHNPYDSVWGPMHWAHAVSKDLITWEHKEIALTPTEDYEKDYGCFSGSAIEFEGKHVLMYTSAGGTFWGPQKQQQCIAIGDGNHYTKSPSNPVIGEKDLPDFAQCNDFRDPKMIQHGDYIYSIIGSRVEESGVGTILLYRTKNLIDWEYVGETLRADKSMGIVFECPDLFKLGDKYVIVTSPIHMEQQGNKYANLSVVIYLVGDMDFETGKFTPEYYDELDSGLDFYAPQSMEDENGRRILIAWAQGQDRNMPSHLLGHGWASCMSLPRELILEGNRLVQRPISELVNYESNEQTDLSKGNQEQYRLQVKIDTTSGSFVKLELLKTPAGAFTIYVDIEKNTVTVDRSKSFFQLEKNPVEKDLKGKRIVEIERKANLELDIIVDTSIVEVFIDGGRYTMTSNYYTETTEITSNLESDCTVEIRKVDIG